MIKICLHCKKEYDRKNARSYCIECSLMISKAVATMAKQKYVVSKGSQKRKEQYHQKRQVSRESSEERPVTEYESKDGHGIKVVLPFTRDFSKNKMRVCNGRIVRWKATNDAMKTLTEEVTLLGHEFFQAKIWLDIVIYQPDHFGDALNYIDTFADAIEKAIGINDRWYAIKNLNWHIDKNNPRLEIKILQTATEHYAICQFCGAERKFTEFNEATQRRLNAQIENGSGSAGQRICLTCKQLNV